MQKKLYSWFFKKEYNANSTETEFPGAVVLTEKLVYDKTCEKIGVAESHFITHGYAISLFVVVVAEWKAIGCKY